jgi:hypothetical protein
MAEAHEESAPAAHEEHADHEAHAEGGHSGGPGKGVGLTMAILGVMLAVCAAFVGSERTEFVKTLVEQSNVLNEYQAASAKYRLLFSQLQQTYAVTPSRSAADNYVKEFDAMLTTFGAERVDVANTIKHSTRELLRLLQPRQHEVKSLIATIQRYEEERNEAKAWAESFGPEAEARFEASEWYEKAQLVSEVGIVIASIALLMGSRPLWYVSIAAAVGCAALIGFSWYTAHKRIAFACDEGSDGAPPVPIAWEPPTPGAAADAKVCVPGATQRIHHAEHSYQAFRNRTVAVGGVEIAFRDIADRGILCRVIKRFDVTPNPPDCQGIVDAMDALESGKAKVEKSP